jgi:hypothetical protein
MHMLKCCLSIQISSCKHYCTTFWPLMPLITDELITAGTSASHSRWVAKSACACALIFCEVAAAAESSPARLAEREIRMLAFSSSGQLQGSDERRRHRATALWRLGSWPFDCCDFRYWPEGDTKALAALCARTNGDAVPYQREFWLKFNAQYQKCRLKNE